MQDKATDYAQTNVFLISFGVDKATPVPWQGMDKTPVVIGKACLAWHGTTKALTVPWQGMDKAWHGMARPRRGQQGDKALKDLYLLQSCCDISLSMGIQPPMKDVEGRMRGDVLGGRDESERRRAESQWIVAARPLCHLQYPVAYLSRLQRILPAA